MKLGIISALSEEIELVIEHISDKKVSLIGKRTYYEGTFSGMPVVAVFSHWGKVASAITAACLIDKFNVDAVIFSGVAGAVSAELNIGDVVIGTHFYQHDMDGRPIFSRYELPLENKKEIRATPNFSKVAFDAAAYFLKDTVFNQYINKETQEKFKLHRPKCIAGAIASGDQFISDTNVIQRIMDDLPDVVCIEMEGAAVAQVCDSYEIPFSVIRTISDAANESAHSDFAAFCNEAARYYSFGIISEFAAFLQGRRFVGSI